VYAELQNPTCISHKYTLLYFQQLLFQKIRNEVDKMKLPIKHLTDKIILSALTL
jgi:hypothetical protein